MNDEDIEDVFEDELQEETQLVEDVAKTETFEPVPDEPRQKSPWKAFILTGLIAALFGAAGGGYGAYAGLKALTPAPNDEPKVDLSPIESRLKQLTDRVSAAEATARKAANRPVVEPEPVDMSPLEDRLTALETAPSPEIDPEALKALQAAQDDGFEWPDTSEIENRIAALEKLEETVPELKERLAALEDDIETLENTDPAPAVDGEKLTDLETRLSVLEDRPALAAPSASDGKKLTALTTRIQVLENRPVPAATVERVSILAFPKDRMILAAENNVQGGLIKKTISHHIRVRSANDPFTLIEGIETDISEGQLAAAAKKFERLPEPVRDVGQAWYESVKASL